MACATPASDPEQGCADDHVDATPGAAREERGGRRARRPPRADRCPPAAAAHRPQDPGRRSHWGLHQGTAARSPQWGSPLVHTGTQSKTKTPPQETAAPGRLLFLGYAEGETHPVSPFSSRPRAAATAELPGTGRRAAEAEDRAGGKAQPARPSLHAVQLLGVRPPLPERRTLPAGRLRFVVMNQAEFFNKYKMRLYVNYWRIMPIQAIPPA